MTKLNCWQYMKCGREPGGLKAKELGVCPAAADTKTDGLNGGKNGGRVCWALAGTLCGEKVQGTFAAKYDSCLNCRFYNLVNIEEGKDKVCTDDILQCLNKACRENKK